MIHTGLPYATRITVAVMKSWYSFRTRGADELQIRMSFTSLEFILFFPIVVAAFFVLPHRFRSTLLLIASYYFYMSWEPVYALLMFATTCIDYLAGRLMDGASLHRRRAYLFASLAVNLGILFVFKYFNFFFENLTSVLQFLQVEYSGPIIHVLLPVGISFYTFQSLSYTIDVYRGARPAERHFGLFALYVSFFPQLVAGPIENSKHLLPQFYKEITFDRVRAVTGLRLVLWGFFKKLVIADNAGRLVDMVYANYLDTNGLALTAATFFFAIQIYADFSAYSDIARGTARVLGYDLMVNFRQPYFARSIREFWSRWHISLMKWFQEYLYIPLGGNRVTRSKLYRNILIVFLISGLWHGANWTFVVWGLLNAVYIIGERLYEGVRNYTGTVSTAYSAYRETLTTAVQIIGTFMLTLIGWVFFRAEHIGMAVYILKKSASDLWSALFSADSLITMVVEARPLIPLSLNGFFGLLTAIGILFAVDVLIERGLAGKVLSRMPGIARYGIYYGLIAYIVLYGYFGETDFIYFQF